VSGLHTLAQDAGMIAMDINGHAVAVASPAQLEQALARARQLPRFELWMTSPAGTTLCMLRNGAHAWLMFVPGEGEPGVRSCGDPARPGSVDYLLGNGQLDPYPLSWCVEVEHCLGALASFHRSGGDRPQGIAWADP